MKKLFVLAFAAICVCSSNVFAQKTAENNPNNSCPNTNGCVRNNRAKSDKSARKAFNPFEGITLTAEQQTKLDALKAECKSGREACGNCNGCPRQASCDKNCKAGENCRKADCQTSDSKENAINKRNEQQRECLNKVKAILTPEQYEVFLENIAVSRPAGHHGDKGKMARNGRKGHCMRHGAQGKAVSAQTDKAAKN